MQYYEVDECVQEHVPDDAVNVNCVASWRVCADAEGRVASLFVNLQNSWYFDSRQWNGHADAPGQLLRVLLRNERGRLELSPE